MSITIVRPTTKEGRLALKRGLAQLRQQGLEPRAFAQFFWTMARGLDYDDCALKKAFNRSLDDPLPEWEMEQLQILNFWDFSDYVHYRKDWQILNPPDDVSSDHPTIPPSSNQDHHHLPAPTVKRRIKKKQVTQVAACPRVSSARIPIVESTKSTTIASGETQSLELNSTSGKVSQSTSDFMSVKSDPVTLQSVMSSVDSSLSVPAQATQDVKDPSTSRPGRRTGRRARAREARALRLKTVSAPAPERPPVSAPAPERPPVSAPAPERPPVSAPAPERPPVSAPAPERPPVSAPAPERPPVSAPAPERPPVSAPAPERSSVAVPFRPLALPAPPRCLALPAPHGSPDQPAPHGSPDQPAPALPAPLRPPVQMAPAQPAPHRSPAQPAPHRPQVHLHSSLPVPLKTPVLPIPLDPLCIVPPAPPWSSTWTKDPSKLAPNSLYVAVKDINSLAPMRISATLEGITNPYPFPASSALGCSSDSATQPLHVASDEISDSTHVTVPATPETLTELTCNPVSAALEGISDKDPEPVLTALEYASDLAPVPVPTVLEVFTDLAPQPALPVPVGSESIPKPVPAALKGKPKFNPDPRPRPKVFHTKRLNVSKGATTFPIPPIPPSVLTSSSGFQRSAPPWLPQNNFPGLFPPRPAAPPIFPVYPGLAPHSPSQLLPPVFPALSSPSSFLSHPLSQLLLHPLPLPRLDAWRRPFGGGYCQDPALTALSLLSVFNVSLFVLCISTWLSLLLCWPCAPLVLPPCFPMPRPLV
ncbi:uncharacterized protein [Danio rerio]|uniref:Uncharacterized protein n=1 Tax=Danio rerio TaxID=7955 RepID=A0AC58JWL2_DANRE